MVLSDATKKELRAAFFKAADEQAERRYAAEVAHWQTMHDREPNTDEIENIVVSYYDRLD
jgi:cytochrome c-type biogenesis protein CcmH/NrfG